jgi:hypothetical protein
MLNKFRAYAILSMSVHPSPDPIINFETSKDLPYQVRRTIFHVFWAQLLADRGKKEAKLMNGSLVSFFKPYLKVEL